MRRCVARQMSTVSRAVIARRQLGKTLLDQHLGYLQERRMSVKDDWMLME